MSNVLSTIMQAQNYKINTLALKTIAYNKLVFIYLSTTLTLYRTWETLGRTRNKDKNVFTMSKINNIISCASLPFTELPFECLLAFKLSQIFSLSSILLTVKIILSTALFISSKYLTDKNNDSIISKLGEFQWHFFWFAIVLLSD